MNMSCEERTLCYGSICYTEFHAAYGNTIKKSIMDWIHCNSCFLQPGEMKGMQYVLTSCGHIYCGNCLRPGSTDRCKICKNACTSIPLTSEMTPDVQEFFTGVDEWLNKLLDILAFQNGHRLRLVAYNQAMGKKYKNLKEENRKLKEIIQALQRKTKDLEKELQSVKRKLMRPPSVNESGHSSNFVLTPSTPTSNKSLNNSPRFPGLSPVSSPSPSPSPSQHSRASSSKNWITPNRLTHSPFSVPSPGGWSPDNEKSHISRRTSVPSSHHGRNFSTPPYRNVASHYSSQSNTPRTPSDCGAPLTPCTPRTPDVSDPFSLALTTPASVCRPLPHYSSQSNTSRTPSDSGIPHTPGSPQTPDLSVTSSPALPISASLNRMISQMSHTTSATTSLGLLSLNSQRSSRDTKYT